MELEKFKIIPSQNSFEPEFRIELQFGYEEISRIPFKHVGFLFLDEVRVATLQEYLCQQGRDNRLRAINQSKGSKWAHYITMIAPFSRQVLEKLEEKRNLNPKGDLILRLILELHVFEPSFEVHHSKEALMPAQTITLAESAIFKYKMYDYSREIKISSGDWIHDFIPVYENGKYQVFEVPVPKLENKNGKLGERINEAINSIRLMEKEKIDGEWNNVVKESRPVWELLKSRAEIAEILRNDYLNDSAIESLSKLIDAFFDFTSKFIHKQSKSNEVMYNKASKEDAQMIYAMSVSIVNLITRKMDK